MELADAAISFEYGISETDLMTRRSEIMDDLRVAMKARGQTEAD